jgi:hypothetical protein
MTTPNSLKSEKLPFVGKGRGGGRRDPGNEFEKIIAQQCKEDPLCYIPNRYKDSKVYVLSEVKARGYTLPEHCCSEFDIVLVVKNSDDSFRVIAIIECKLSFLKCTVGGFLDKIEFMNCMKFGCLHQGKQIFLPDHTDTEHFKFTYVSKQHPDSNLMVRYRFALKSDVFRQILKYFLKGRPSCELFRPKQTSRGTRAAINPEFVRELFNNFHCNYMNICYRSFIGEINQTDMFPSFEDFIGDNEFVETFCVNLRPEDCSIIETMGFSLTKPIPDIPEFEGVRSLLGVFCEIFDKYVFHPLIRDSDPFLSFV